MKVVIAVEEFDPNKGYLEYYLARELTKMGHRVYIFTFGWEKGISRTMFEEGFEVINLPHVAVVHSYHVPSLSGVAYITRFIKGEKPDIVHCQPLYSPLSLLFVGIKQLFGYRIVGSLITAEFSIDDITKKLMFFCTKIITRFYIKDRCELIFAISKQSMKMMTQLFNIPSQKFRIIPLGADIRLFKFDASARSKVRRFLEIREDEIVAIYSGKLLPHKKIDVLLYTCAPLIKTHTNFKILLVGEGSKNYVDYLKGIINELDITHHVMFHKWVHRTKLPDLYNAADFAVWPGHHSISMIEAMSVGLPLVIPRSKLTNYLLDYKNGLDFVEGDTSGLRACIQVMLEDEELRRNMGVRSCKLVKDRLNWNTIAERYIEVLQSAIKKEI